MSQVNIFNHVQHYIRAKIQTLGLEDLQILFNKVKDINVLHLKVKQDGPSIESPSIESSLYLNMTLRYLGPLDHGTFGPLDLGSLGPWDLFPPPPPPHIISDLHQSLPPTSSYLLLCSPISFYIFLLPLGLVWFNQL